MGFEGLFGLVGKRLPRNLCYWLATRVDVVNRKLITHDGMEFPLFDIQVNWVMGIPIANKSVPNRVLDDSMQAHVDRLKQKYVTHSPSTKGIRRTVVCEVVTFAEVTEVEFKEAFLMLALMDVICPTTCHRLSMKLLPAVTVASNSKSYNWCSFLLEHMFTLISNFAKRFYADGSAKGLGGASIFLAVLYLDRLQRHLVCWGVWPRMKAWSLAEINKALAEDQREGGDFGKLGCVDVAYGEEHCMLGRDRLPVLGVIGTSGNGQLHACDLLSFMREMGGGQQPALVDTHVFESCYDRAKRPSQMKRNVLNPWEYKRLQEQTDGASSSSATTMSPNGAGFSLISCALNVRNAF